MALYAILTAIETNKINVVRSLSAYPTTLLEDTKGRTALGFAAYTRNMQIIEILLENNHDINHESELCSSCYDEKHLCQHSPLLAAINNRDIKMVKYLLKNDADPNTDNSACLYRAIMHQNLPIVKLLIEHNAFLDGCAFKSACKYSFDVLKYLIELEPNIDIPMDIALFAAESNDIRVVQLFTERKTQFPSDALLYNILHERISYIELLLKTNIQVLDLHITSAIPNRIIMNMLKVHRLKMDDQYLERYMKYAVEQLRISDVCFLLEYNYKPLHSKSIVETACTLNCSPIELVKQGLDETGLLQPYNNLYKIECRLSFLLGLLKTNQSTSIYKAFTSPLAELKVISIIFFVYM